MNRPAHSVARTFEPAPPAPSRLDRHHYLVSVSRGALRLEHGGTAWSLPPARAALVAAGQTIEVTIPHTIVTSAVLVGDDPRMGRIAADVGLAPRTLTRRFEDELGMTWRAALRRQRVLRAIELLAGTDATVTEVAMLVGYGSLSAFRDLTGRTPTGCRAGFRPTWRATRTRRCSAVVQAGGGSLRDGVVEDAEQLHQSAPLGPS